MHITTNTNRTNLHRALRRVGQVALAMAPVAFLIVETAGRT